MIIASTFTHKKGTGTYSFSQKTCVQMGFFQIFCEMDIVMRCLSSIQALGAQRELFRYQESPPAGKQLSTRVLQGQ